MKTFKQYVTEAKQVGTVYHYTTVPKLHNMLQENPPMTMKSLNGEAISTTRNHNLPIHGKGYLEAFRHTRVRIALDGDKISEHHKVKPVAGLIDNESDILNHKHNEHRVNRSSGEAEEAIMKHPFHAKEYIKHIHIDFHRDHDAEFKQHVEPLLKHHNIEYTYGRGACHESVDYNYSLDNDAWFIIIPQMVPA